MRAAVPCTVRLGSLLTPLRPFLASATARFLVVLPCPEHEIALLISDTGVSSELTTNSPIYFNQPKLVVLVFLVLWL